MTSANRDDPAPVLRLLRALLVAGMAMSVGALGHTSAGGLLPSAPILLALFGALTALSAWVLTRPATYAGLSALVVGGQMAAHGVFTAMSGHPGDHVPAAATGLITVAPGGVRAHLSVVEPSIQVSTGPVTPHWMQHLLHDLTGADLAMSLAHAGAAAVVAGWLFLGERALIALLLMLRCRLDLSLSLRCCSFLDAAPLLPERPRSSSDHDDLQQRLHRANTRGNAARRGPPLPWLLPTTSPAT